MTHNSELLDRTPLLTPALVIDEDAVANNIEATVALLGGDPRRWRPHVKTAKLASVMRQMVQHGVTSAKCATTLELKVACEAGFDDVLLAYPALGARATRTAAIATAFPAVRLSVLVEDRTMCDAWRGTGVGAFIDLNPGMDRTGVDAVDTNRVMALARAVIDSGIEFRGLHYYDGHVGGLALDERTRVAHAGYDRLLDVVGALERSGIRVLELVTAGTPAFPCTASYPGFRNASFVHRASPGTVVYGDATSARQLPSECGYAPAAVVLSTVVSHPARGVITCDAGHKTVSADAGVPTCQVVGRPDLEPMAPSEEHLPIRVPPAGSVPALGERLTLLPRHICPTVNNFDLAIVLRQGRLDIEPVSARGREAPMVA